MKVKAFCRAIGDSGLGLNLVGLGLLGALLVIPFWVNQLRTTGLALEGELGPQMQSSFAVEKADPWTPGWVTVATWRSHIRRMDEALSRKDVGAAELAWHDAYVQALGSRRWEGMVEVGDAYLHIGQAARGSLPAEAKARRLYLAGLFRARNQDSLEGVLGATEAFARLGDHETVAQGLRMAEVMAQDRRDNRVRERVRAFTMRVSAASRTATNVSYDPF